MAFHLLNNLKLVSFSHWVFLSRKQYVFRYDLAYLYIIFKNKKGQYFVICLFILLTVYLGDVLPQYTQIHLIFLRLWSIPLYECTTTFLCPFEGHCFCYYKYATMKVSRHAWASIFAESIPKRGISEPQCMHTFRVLPNCLPRIILFLTPTKVTWECLFSHMLANTV